jgi:hypothetical protein
MKVALFFLLSCALTDGFISPPASQNHMLESASSSTSLSGVRSAVRRVRDSVLSKERSREDLKIGIAGFYDRSSKLWEDVWGEVSTITYCCTSYKLSLIAMLKSSFVSFSYYFFNIAHAPWVLYS